MVFQFAGEIFLTNAPPDIELERRNLVLSMILSSVIFVLIIPKYLMKYEEVGSKESKSYKNKSTIENDSAFKYSSPHESVAVTTRTKLLSSSTIKRRHIKTVRKVRTIVSSQSSSSSKQKIKSVASSELNKSERNGLPSFIYSLINLIWLISLIVIILFSSNNTYNARSTFQAPLLTQKECKYIIEMANKAAKINLQDATDASERVRQSKKKRNKNKNLSMNELSAIPLTDIQESYLTEPKGWHKARHSQYPTTDLNLMSDPFTDEDRLFLKHILNARLAPLIERIYGVKSSALRANDMFVVRYDADNQAYLKRHTDSGDISFNVLLNDDFTGGGTRYWNRATNENYLIQPLSGEVILSNAMINHEGVRITSGERFILVGFLNVDQIDPFSKEQTGLSLFASWFSMVWVLNRAKYGYHRSLNRLDKKYDFENLSQGKQTKTWLDNKYGRAFFFDCYNLLQKLGDLWAPHSHQSLIQHSDDQMKQEVYENYIQTMDLSYQTVALSENSSLIKLPSWFERHNLELDFDGSYVRHSESGNNAQKHETEDDGTVYLYGEKLIPAAKLEA